MRNYLSKEGINTGVHYPVALPYLPPFRQLNYTEKQLPIVSKYQKKILSLPMYPELNQDDITLVVNELKDAL